MDLGFLGDEADDVAAVGTHVYVADPCATYSGGLLVIDVSDPADPHQVGRCNPPDHNFYHVAAAGNHAYVTDQGTSQTGVMVIDVSEPTNPQEVGACNTGGPYGCLAVAGNYLYQAGSDSGFTVIDVSNPLNPHPVGYDKESTVGCGGLAVGGDHAYVLNGYDLVVIDISNPAHPTTVGSASCYPYLPVTSSGEPLAVAGRYAYVGGVDQSSSPVVYGIAVVDVLDPLNPRLVGHYATPDGPWGVAAVESLAYLADNNAGLQIVRFLGVGIEETPNAAARTTKPATIVHGILRLPVSPFTIRTSLFDMTGRQVMALRSGTNDVSHLTPGVYFVREASGARREASSVER